MWPLFAAFTKDMCNYGSIGVLLSISMHCGGNTSSAVIRRLYFIINTPIGFSKGYSKRLPYFNI